jgi:uncharacterized protein (TIGR02145 family)
MYEMKKISISVSIIFLTGCSLFQSPKIEVEVDPIVVEVQENAFVCGRDKVKDGDGNEYNTAYFDIDGGHDVTKEGQCWMTENLNVGRVILNPDQEPSDDGVIEKWCMNKFEGHTPSPFHNTAESDVTYCDGLKFLSEVDLLTDEHKYGGLYSWSEIQNNTKVCPEGWNIPSSEDWKYLIEQMDLDYEYLSFWIHENEKSIKLFEVGEKEFPIKNIGYRRVTGEYESNNIYAPAYFWLSSEDPLVISFGYGETSAWFGVTKKSVKAETGASVRCVKNKGNTIVSPLTFNYRGCKKLVICNDA